MPQFEDHPLARRQISEGDLDFLLSWRFHMPLGIACAALPNWSMRSSGPSGVSTVVYSSRTLRFRRWSRQILVTIRYSQV